MRSSRPCINTSFRDPEIASEGKKGLVLQPSTSIVSTCPAVEGEGVGVGRIKRRPCRMVHTYDSLFCMNCSVDIKLYNPPMYVVYGHTTTAMNEIEYISPIEYTPPHMYMCHAVTDVVMVTFFFFFFCQFPPLNSQKVAAPVA